MTNANFSGHFGGWLRFKLEERDLDIYNLARHSEISTVKILDIIHGVQEADAEFCHAVAPAMEMPEEHMLCMVDALSQLPSPEEDLSFAEIRDLMMSLSPEGRMEIMKYVRWCSNEGAQ
jgi:hypothetical protein